MSEYHIDENENPEESNAPLENRNSTLQLLALFSIIFISAGFFFKLGGIFLSKIYGIEDLNAFLANQENWINQIDALILFQILSAIGTFIVPGVLFVFLIDKSPKKYLKIDKLPSPKMAFLTILLIFASSFAIDLLVRAMELIPFENMDNTIVTTLLESEKNAENLFAAFLSFESVGGFLAIFFMMAILPAVGEELIFRGLLQNIFQKQLQNKYIAIGITAFLFALIHLQLYNFPALIFMGFVLGLIYFWTKNLWLAILAHLFNNGLIVTLSACNQLGLIEFDFQTVESFPIWVSLIGMACFVPLVWFYKKQALKTATN